MTAPQPAPYGYGNYAPPVPRNGFGITALVLAIIGLVFGLIPLTGFIALILGALATLFGLLGLGRVRKGQATNRNMSIVGTILGVTAAALGIWGIVILFQVTDQLVTDLNQTSETFEQQMQESATELDAYNNCIEDAGQDLDAMSACTLGG